MCRLLVNVLKLVVCLLMNVVLMMCGVLVVCVVLLSLSMCLVIFLISVKLLLSVGWMNVDVILVFDIVSIFSGFCGLVKCLRLCFFSGLIDMIVVLCFVYLCSLFIICGWLVVGFWLKISSVFVCLKLLSVMVFLLILIDVGSLWFVVLWYMFE